MIGDNTPGDAPGPSRLLYLGDSPTELLDLAEDLWSDGPPSLCLPADAADAVRSVERLAFDCLVVDAPMSGDLTSLFAAARANDAPVVCWNPAGGDCQVAPDVAVGVARDREELAAAVAAARRSDDRPARADERPGGGEPSDEATARELPADGTPPFAPPEEAGERDAPPSETAEEVAQTAEGAAPDSVAAAGADTPAAAADDEWRRRELLDVVLDSLDDIYFVFDTDRRLVDWNARLEETTGLGPDELAGMDPLSLLAPEDRDDAMDEFLTVVVEGQAAGEFDIVDREGARHPHEFVASLIADEDGVPRYVCGIGRDVSELRQKQAQLEEKQAQLEAVLEELERSNAELEQFAYTASHDLKEPLRMVVSYLDLLERRAGPDLDEDAREFLEYAVDGGQRMRRMIDQLLEFSRIGRTDGRFEPVDLETVLARAIRNLEVAIEESDARVEVGDLPTVPGHRERLVQLFQNLVGNAIKYAGDGPPRVTVEARRIDAAALPDVPARGGDVAALADRLSDRGADSLASTSGAGGGSSGSAGADEEAAGGPGGTPDRSGGEGAADRAPTGEGTGESAGAWEIAVSDEGVGIPEDRIDQVFDIFYSGAGGGTDSTGIGLAIAQKIVEFHGGAIDVESTPGEGTTFYVRLPSGERYSDEGPSPGVPENADEDIDEFCR